MPEAEFATNGEAFDVPFSVSDTDGAMVVQEHGGTITPLQDAIQALQVRAAAAQEATRLGLVQCAVAPENYFTRYPGNKFRLTGAGAAKLLPCFGAEVLPAEHDADECGPYTDDQGREHFAWFSFVTVIVKGIGQYTGNGHWSSERADYMTKRAVGDTNALRPLTKEERATIRKCADTQAFINAVQRLLGVEALSEEQLREAGVDVSRIKAVEFKERGQGGRGQSADNEDGDKLRAEIRDMLSDVDVEDMADVDKIIVALSAFKSKRDNKTVAGRPLSALTIGRLNATKDKVRRIVQVCKDADRGGPADVLKASEKLRDQEVSA